MADYKKKFMDDILAISNKQTVRELFFDFLELTAVTLSNQVDIIHSEEREKRYFELSRKYTKDQFRKFAPLMGHLYQEIDTHAEKPMDVLGPIYTELGLNTKQHQQVFTPNHISNMMAKLVASDMDGRLTKDIQENGYISLLDPCMGAGGMALSLAGEFDKKTFNFQKQMLAFAADTDILCVYMCYIHYYLYGIPAVIVHGDSLTGEVWETWYTALYILDGWSWRSSLKGSNSILYAGNEKIGRKPKETNIMQPHLDFQISRDGHVQLAF